MSHRLSHRLRHHRWRHHFLELVRLTNNISRISRPDITLECLRWIISRDWTMWHNSSLSQSDRHICVMCVTNVTKRRFALSSFRYVFKSTVPPSIAYAFLRSSMVLVRISFDIFFCVITSFDISLTQLVHRSISTSRAFKNGDSKYKESEDRVRDEVAIWGSDPTPFEVWDSPSLMGVTSSDSSNSDLPISISSGFESRYDCSRCWIIETTWPNLSEGS